MSSLDLAISHALGLSPEKCIIQAHGSSGFAQSYKVTTEENGQTKHYFVKTGPEGEMFAGEHMSLNAIHDAVPSFCPRSITHGPLENSKNSFLLTDYIDFNLRQREGKAAMSLAEKLAAMHSKIAPVPSHHDRPMYGFPVTTYCGSTPQKNDYRSSWSEFYADCRLRFILDFAEQKQGSDKALRSKIEAIIDTVVPRLLRDGHLGGSDGIKPALVHGDLWSGNKSQGTIGGEGTVEDVVFDPSCCYAHSEYEVGIMTMFGGFSSSFFREYHKLLPKTKPESEYQDRISLYQL